MSALVLFSLTLLYLFPLVLLGLVLTHRRQHPRWHITLMLSVLPLFYIGHYQALNAIQGWPSGAPLPAEFRLLGFVISEPNHAVEDQGEILLWVRDTDGGKARVHRLPYAKDLHQALVDAGHEQAAGHSQVGRRSRPESSGASGSAKRSQESISFRRAQPPALPEKTSEL